jgi:AhpD family alkylhydroperoxidase
VLLTDAVTNPCAWAVAFHTALALKEGLDPADVQAIREGRLPKDGKLAALSVETTRRRAMTIRDAGCLITECFSAKVASPVVTVAEAS